MIDVDLTGAPATMLATLYGRALDARSPHPILHDTMAAAAVEQIGYDFAATGITAELAANVVVRARFFDDWVRDFLREHPAATVVHLGAGTDTRFWRVDPGPGTLWFDVDLPEVVALREQLFPAREGYRTIAASVTGDGWLDAIPTGRPTLIVAEGLTMYLEPEAGRDLFRRLTAYFGAGTVAFDVFNRLGIRFQKQNPAVRAAHATLHWAVDDPRELARAIPGWRLTDSVRALYAPYTEHLALRQRIVAQLVRIYPPIRDVARYLRYEFTTPA
ncbi:class I SAM-dependent methyltransferase [Hamadaea tsunoensis]|uniref:class I SAM-dependent methyltransferase n=1 Tax=Hamadaea tsunoensis TaxID=53368 RepID=UPI000403D9F2|nr:class I SAM-dependent methyltransferase [Hamadaea tsunoensis]